MTWHDLDPGGVLKRAGADANLVWALATRFRDFLRPDEPVPTRIPVIVELKKGYRVGHLVEDLGEHGGTVPPAYHDKDTRYCTAEFALDYCRKFFAGTAGTPIARFELQMPVIPQRPRPSAAQTPAADAASPKPAEPPARAQDALLGVIDSGCPFARSSLRDETGLGTRVLALWSQDKNLPLRLDGAPAAAPQAFGYGSQATRERLNAVMDETARRDGAVDEAACYSLLDYRALRQRFVHGGVVLDLLAGRLPLGARIGCVDDDRDDDQRPSWTPIDGEAAHRADVAFVQLPADAVQDSSSAGLPRLLLDGLRYIVGCAGEKTSRIVVNVSDGSSRGTHDGSSIFERAAVSLARKPEAPNPRCTLDIVFAAGNSFDEERHAQFDGMQPGESRSVTLRVAPDSEAPSYVLVRLPRGCKAASLRVVPPGCPDEPDGKVASGQAKGWPQGTSPQCGVVFPAASPYRATLALIAIAPTRVVEGWTTPAAPCGDWRIEVSSSQAPDEPVHLYIARNQTNPGALRRGLQARFVDEAYDPERHRRRLEDDPPTDSGRAPSPLRRRGTLNALACVAPGRGVTVVESRMLRNRKPSLYSSDGPAAGAAASNAPLRRQADAYAIGDMSRALPGINAAGTWSGSVVRVRGTSFAAPQVARQLFNSVPARAPAPARVPVNNQDYSAGKSVQAPVPDPFRSDTTGQVGAGDSRT